MPMRATKRGAERTPLDADVDVLICGASFGGLAVARELAGIRGPRRPRVLMLDRYEVGERQTSACGAPTVWLDALDLPELQRFGELVCHTRHRTARFRLPWTFSTFDYRDVCAELRAQGEDARFETATVAGRSGNTVHTDRGDVRAPLIVDGLGWRRILAAGENVQPPEAFLSRGLEVHPGGTGDELAIWIDPDYVPAGYGWSFPARDEVRIGIGSFDPRFHVKEPTVRLTRDEDREPRGFQGNWIPHRLRPAAADGVFFVGDSAGHCIPLTAEGIRTAWYFGVALGRELRAVLAGYQTREHALRSYAAFSAGHRWKWEAMLRWQRVIPRMSPRALAVMLRAMESRRYVDWAFGHYLELAHPRIVGPARVPVRRAVSLAA